MATFKTPGVYIEEVSTIPPSVAGVPTAVPGFVGYTKQAVLLDGTPVTNVPVRITSLLQYEQIFGGPKDESFTVTLTDGASGTLINISPPTTSGLSNFILYYQVQMFYANGGGTCYVVSVGDYSTPVSPLSNTVLKAGLDKLEQVDEVTLLVVPENVFTGANQATVNNAMLSQSAKLQDRFSVMDVIHSNGNSILEDADDFRNGAVGPDNLKYGASYYPALKTVLRYFYTDSNVAIVDNRTPVVYSSPNNKLSSVKNGKYVAAVAATGTLTVDDYTGFAIGDTIVIYGTTLTSGLDFTAAVDNDTTALSILNAISLLIPSVSGVIDGTNDNQINLTATVAGISGNVPITSTVAVADLGIVGMAGGVDQQTTVAANPDLYNSITAKLALYTLDLYPSATMCGVYARVDADRGVWKAPANVGMALVSAPSINITNPEQENLNVDSVSGKSINAIRNFPGRGNIVWGARTLAGNDNEWRYVNVRRLFIFAEESIKKATEFVVFEPNTANTWNRVRGMAEAFLTSLWKDGALAGAAPQDAFFVNVGLGTTMTAQDILEGKMIVEIGMAASRPAEFIILRFSHKLQQS